MPEKIKDTSSVGTKITKDSLEAERVDTLLRQYETGAITRANYYRKLKEYRI